MTSPAFQKARENPVKTVVISVAATVIAAGLILREQALVYGSELEPVQSQVSQNHDLLLAVRLELTVKRMRDEKHDSPAAWSDADQRDLEKYERQLERAEDRLLDPVTPQ